MIDPRCHVGETHGIYTLVDVLDEKDKYGHWIYKGICNVCGREKCSHYGDFSGPKSMTTVCTHIGIKRSLSADTLTAQHYNQKTNKVIMTYI